VEFHQASWVMRQFGFCQPIPAEPMNLDQVHKEDMRADKSATSHNTINNEEVMSYVKKNKKL